MMSNPFDELNEHLDDNIPDEVLQSDGWSPRLLPDLDRLTDTGFDYDDIVEDFE